MKQHLLFLLSVMWTPFLVCQTAKDITIPFDTVTQKYTYNKIIEVPGKTARELSTLTKKWCVEKFLDDKFIVDDPDIKIVDLGKFPINFTYKVGGRKIPTSYTIIFSLTGLFKDGKCKIETTNIKMTQNAKGTTNEQPIETYQKNMENLGGPGKRKAKEVLIITFNEIDINMKRTLIELEKVLKGDLSDKKEW
jgi:hypothetical protein